MNLDHFFIIRDRFNNFHETRPIAEQSRADSKHFHSDQGLNSWQLDWSNTGGYNTSSPWYLPVPCSCGYQGSGTQAFYEALGARSIDVEWVSAACQANLQTVEPMLDLTTENIAWNRISGGIPPSQTIDYGQGWTANVPAQMPTPCYMGEEFCPPGKDAGTSDPGSIRGGR